jgi:hypothetical protein
MIDRIAVGAIVAGILITTIGFVSNKLIVGAAGLVLMVIGWQIARR